MGYALELRATERATPAIAVVERLRLGVGAAPRGDRGVEIESGDARFTARALEKDDALDVNIPYGLTQRVAESTLRSVCALAAESGYDIFDPQLARAIGGGDIDLAMEKWKGGNEYEMNLLGGINEVPRGDLDFPAYAPPEIPLRTKLAMGFFAVLILLFFATRSCISPRETLPTLGPPHGWRPAEPRMPPPHR